MYEPAADKQVLDTFKELHGVVGLAHAGIKAVEKYANRSILRVSHDHVDKLKAALVLSNKKSVLVSGALKKAREALV